MKVLCGALVWAAAASLGLAHGGRLTDLLVARMDPSADKDSSLKSAFDDLSVTASIRREPPVPITTAWLILGMYKMEPVLEIMDGRIDDAVQKAVGPYAVGLATSYQDMPRSTCRVEQTVHMNRGLDDDEAKRRESNVHTKTVDKSCFEVRSARLTDNTTGKEPLPWWSKSLERYTIAQDRPRSRRSKSLKRGNQDKTKESKRSRRSNSRSKSRARLSGSSDPSPMKDGSNHIGEEAPPEDLSLDQGGSSIDLLVTRLKPPPCYRDFLYPKKTDREMLWTFKYLREYMERHERPIRFSFIWDDLEMFDSGPTIETITGTGDAAIQEAIGPYGVALANSYSELPDNACRVEQTVYVNRKPVDDDINPPKSKVYEVRVEKPCVDVRSEITKPPVWSRSIVNAAARRRDDEFARSLGAKAYPYKQTISDFILIGSHDACPLKDEWHHIVYSPPIYEKPRLSAVYDQAVGKLKSNPVYAKPNISTALDILEPTFDFITDNFVDPSPFSRGRKRGGSVVFETSLYQLEDNSCVLEQILYLYGLTYSPNYKRWLKLRGREVWNRRHIVLEQQLGRCDFEEKKEFFKTKRSRGGLITFQQMDEEDESMTDF